MSKKKQDIIIVICVITLVLSVCAIFCIYCMNKNEEFVFNENLDKIVLTVKCDGEAMDVSMQEIAYYIINVEGDVDDMAHQFNNENLNAYWNVKLDKGLYTMRKYAKDLVIEKCVMDNIYYMEALKNNITLTDEEKELASEDAHIILKNMTAKQMDVTDYSFEDLCKIMNKLYLTSKYVGQLMEAAYTMEELDYKGSYYLKLKDEYSYKVEEKLWDEVKLGELTVDRKNN